MSLSIRQSSTQRMDSKSRRFMAVGSLCLDIGLLLHLFIHPSGQTAKDWLDGVSGLLIGISIGTNLFGLVQVRRSRLTAPDQL